jgi:hypothetical protein
MFPYGIKFAICLGIKLELSPISSQVKPSTLVVGHPGNGTLPNVEDRVTVAILHNIINALPVDGVKFGHEGLHVLILHV